MSFAQEPVYYFSTFAGLGGASSATVDGAGSAARFNSPTGVAVDSAGNVFVTEATGHVVRKITPDGVVSTLAGSAGQVGAVDGSGSAARFGSLSTTATSAGSAAVPSGPLGITIDQSDVIYVSDTSNHTIRRITPAGVVTTIAGQARSSGSADSNVGASARFYEPLGLAADSAGNVFVADCYNQVIRRIASDGVVTTIVGTPGTLGEGNGTGASAQFYYPDGITVDRSGNLIVTDANYLVRKITKTTVAGGPIWAASTLAGTARAPGSTDGTAAQALFGAINPAGATITSFLWSPNDTVLPVVLSGNAVVGGLGGLAVDDGGNLFLADTMNHTIRRITPAGVVTTIAGTAGESGRVDAIGSAARFNRPKGLAIDRAGNIYVADSINQTIRKGAIATAPKIQSQPQSYGITSGQSVALAVTATGVPAPTFQWSRDGNAVAGATGASFTLTNVQAADGGRYTVTVTNDLGAVTSSAAVLTVGTVPVISAQPLAQNVIGGQSVTLAVAATGTPAPTFQWRKDGVDLPGATNATLTLSAAQAGDAGSYTVIVSNAIGAVTSGAAAVTVNTSRIVNLSIRSNLAAGGTLTVGFVVAGNGKPLLVRGIGPALGQFGVTGYLADPRVGFFSGSTLVTSNDNWGSAANAAQIAATATQVGAFALPAGSLDAALLTTLDGGGYSAQIAGAGNPGGIVLVELYDANNTTAARLANVSARAQVGMGENALFAGFVISGNVKRTVLIRAIGPTLATFGVTGVLTDPRLELLAAGATTSLASNDDWGGGANIAMAFGAVGAFPLSATSKDAALLATLDPGSYSVQVSGVGGATGEALVEIYEVP